MHVDKPSSASPSKQKGVKDFQEQLREFTLLDKIIPDVTKTVGCLVQINSGDSQRFAEIVSVAADHKSVHV